MSKELFMRAVCVSALLWGCSKSDPWRISSIQTGTTEFSSCKLCYYNPDTVNGIDIEFLSLEDSSHLYLSVHSHPIRPYEKDPQRACISFAEDGRIKTFIGMRHQGGQRVLLSEEAKDYLIRALLDNKTIVVSTSGYSTTVTPISFQKKYPLLQQPGRFNFKIKNPLQ